MSVRGYTFKRLTAALLPLSFLWLCACCVFTCGREAAGADAHSAVSSSAASAEVAGESGCDEGCPPARGLEAASPERPEVKAGLDATPAAAPRPAAASLIDRSARERARGRPPRAAPPLELLSTLRI